MARSLLAPTAFVTLLGLAPACFRASAPPVDAAASAEAADRPSVEAASAAATAVAPRDLVAYATTRSGNARAPSYDTAMVELKGPDNFVELEGVGPPDGAPQAVVLALETTLDLPLAAAP